jgi:hypothetical protein
MVRFEFASGAPVPTGEYYVRGGVCWPRKTAGGEILGCAIICAREMRSGRIFVLAEHEFATVAPVCRPDGGIEDYPYLTQFLTDAWASFFCEAFYRHEDPGVHHLYLMQTLTSPMVEPKPGFPQANWADELTSMSMIHALDESGQLKYLEDGPVHTALRLYEADEKGETFEPPLLALMSAVCGITRRPSYLSEPREE